MTDLGEIETRLNADGAQKPWEAFSNGIQTDYGVQNANGSPFIEGWLYVDDAEFIAHAPSDIAFLLARVRELEQRRDDVLLIHSPETYFHHPEVEEDGADWFGSIENIRDLYIGAWEMDHTVGEGPHDWDDQQVFIEEKTYCSHCMKIVEEANEPHETPFSPLAIWPCPTVRALKEDEA